MEEDSKRKRKVSTLMVVCIMLFFMLAFVIYSTELHNQFLFREDEVVDDDEVSFMVNHSLSYTNRPSIWIIQLLSLHHSQCALPKQIHSYRMFYNELLFDRIVWVVNEPEYTEEKRKELESTYPFPMIHSAPLPEEFRQACQKVSSSPLNPVRRGVAYECQQLNTFYLDQYAEAVAKDRGLQPPDILAIVDTDTQMMTITTLENVFPDGGQRKYNYTRNTWEVVAPVRAFGVGRVLFSGGTEYFLQRPQVADFMNAFPVFLYRDTMTNFRAYVEKIHSKSFVEVFSNIFNSTRGYYSQFAIMQSYGYYYESAKYSVHIQPSVEYYEPYRTLAPNSTPQIRTFLHEFVEKPRDAIKKGCCVTFHLLLDNPNKCWSYNVSETDNYELVCEYPWIPIPTSRNQWRNPDTLITHYKNVRRTKSQLSLRSQEEKMKACSEYVNGEFDKDPYPSCSF